ncbi:MAG TPA: hypothetical protein VGF76_20670 [Polyangiaceae bacterium]|jgi:hypothetical protein
MSFVSIQEAQDLVTFASLARERLELASAKLEAANDEQVEERGWLAAATRRVSEALEDTQSALLEAAELPEFAGARKLKGDALSNAWADAVESVFDAIVANVSGNGPLIEALFPHQRFASLRRPASSAQNFWLEFERRSESAYVRRLCGDTAYEFLPPLLEAAKETERKLREAMSPKPLPAAKADKLRERVAAAAERLELALRQTRSLSEAAFAATPSVVAELGLDAKPKRRVQRSEPAKLSAS